MDDYQFEDITESSAPVAGAGSSDPAAGGASAVQPASGDQASGGYQSYSGGSNGGGRGYADEIFSTKINGRQRTFFIDVKESRNGKFCKISEKSRGQKSTIMFDAEDMPAFIQALNEASAHL